MSIIHLVLFAVDPRDGVSDYYIGYFVLSIRKKIWGQIK